MRVLFDCAIRVIKRVRLLNVRQRVYCLMMHVLVHSVDSGTRSHRPSSSYTSRGSTDRSTCRD